MVGILRESDQSIVASVHTAGRPPEPAPINPEMYYANDFSERTTYSKAVG